MPAVARPSNPRILVAATLGRADILSMFQGLVGRADMTFVEYARNWGEGLDESIYRPYGVLTTWEAHRSARALLDWCRPDRIAMLAVGSRNQLALRIEAARRRIEVVHLEHGYRLPASAWDDAGLRTPRRLGPSSAVRTNRFFAGSTIGAAGLLTLEAGTRATLARAGTAHPRLAAYRRPDRYVSFAPECFEYHRVVDRVPAELARRTIYIGVPQFDCFVVRKTRSPTDQRLAVMADHQLHNGGIRGWSAEFRREWASRIEAVLREMFWRLVVKRHPGDRENVWERADPSVVTQVGSIEELASRAERAALVLGTGSTLQLPLIGSPQTAGAALEIHPLPGPALSGPVVDAQVAEQVADFDDLRRLLGRTEDLHRRQAPHKPVFIDRFLYRLDGKARERLAVALCSSSDESAR